MKGASPQLLTGEEQMIKLKPDHEYVTGVFGIENKEEALQKLQDIVGDGEVTIWDGLQKVLDSDKLTLNEKLFALFYAGQQRGMQMQQGHDYELAEFVERLTGAKVIGMNGTQIVAIKDNPEPTFVGGNKDVTIH